MHDGTEREIPKKAGLGKRDWRGFVVTEIGSRRAEEGGLNPVKCYKGGKMLKLLKT
jgi:hypothetical protein